LCRCITEEAFCIRLQPSSQAQATIRLSHARNQTHPVCSSDFGILGPRASCHSVVLLFRTPIKSATFPFPRLNTEINARTPMKSCQVLNCPELDPRSPRGTVIYTRICDSLFQIYYVNLLCAYHSTYHTKVGSMFYVIFR
jgi:hypothetical protein